MNAFNIGASLIEKINSGVLVVDESFNITFFNKFMESHCLLKSKDVLTKNLFDVFNDLPEKWLKRKIQSVFMLNTPGFSSWEQRQFVFKMRHARPVTTSSEYMAQNITFLPILADESGSEVEQVCILVEDVTDVCFYQEKLKETLEQLEVVSRTDGLTQVANRRFWEERFEVELETANRYKHPLSLILFDLDKFKQINDTYGHQGGDLVLIEITKFIKKKLRQVDLMGRYGGEEFGIILPNTDAEGAFELADRIRTEFAQFPISFGNHKILATISLGVVEYDPSFDSYEDMVTRADIALYQSKASGRNTTSLYRA
ncbi:GGDEF domain-containing protein [Catenovulum maritimum]|uniref:diguanylate cyclase n=1 Tax=Catenovulum maritimum TaxID=1513271 RepID=A0A0J8GV98_9ALTE|nr:diguanylate cyclase [Catenovulum maritimum]KMT66662.1 diguanylate cyclase [Catenovulum maritimum]